MFAVGLSSNPTADGGGRGGFFGYLFHHRRMYMFCRRLDGGPGASAGAAVRSAEGHVLRDRRRVRAQAESPTRTQSTVEYKRQSIIKPPNRTLAGQLFSGSGSPVSRRTAILPAVGLLPALQFLKT